MRVVPVSAGAPLRQREAVHARRAGCNRIGRIAVLVRWHGQAVPVDRRRLRQLVHEPDLDRVALAHVDQWTDDGALRTRAELPERGRPCAVQHRARHRLRHQRGPEHAGLAAFVRKRAQRRERRAGRQRVGGRERGRCGLAARPVTRHPWHARHAGHVVHRVHAGHAGVTGMLRPRGTREQRRGRDTNGMRQEGSPYHQSFLVIHAGSRGRRDARAGRLTRRCATRIPMPASS